MGLFNFIFGRGSKESARQGSPARPALQPEASFVVHVADTGVRCERPDGMVESVTWDDLRAVIIHTTEDGPAAPDVFWILAGASSGCVIPMGATGEMVLLERLQKLPGFDNEAVIHASASVTEQKFLCWQTPTA